jgi:enoyl-CoA hydratase
VDPVEVRTESACTVVVMDDGKANALSLPMLRALEAALDTAEARGLPAVVAGRPGVFSGGFDLKVMTGDDARARTEMVFAGFELAYRTVAADIPVVVACTGHAIAMGVFLMVTGDRRIGAAGEYRIGANETALGIVMPDFATELLRGRLTPSAADRALLTSELFGPDAAVAAGFLDETVPPAAVVERAVAVAEGLAAFDAAVYAETKRRVRGPWLARLRAAIDADAADRRMAP